MEFTTYFGLQFQATRLYGEAIPPDRHYQTGLAPSVGSGNVQADLGSSGSNRSGSPKRNIPPTPSWRDGVLRWALPGSVALTKGIPVGFFSTAY